MDWPSFEFSSVAGFVQALPEGVPHVPLNTVTYWNRQWTTSVDHLGTTHQAVSGLH